MGEDVVLSGGDGVFGARLDDRLQDGRQLFQINAGLLRRRVQALLYRPRHRSLDLQLITRKGNSGYFSWNLQ